MMHGQSDRSGKLSIGVIDASNDYVREAPSAQLAIDLFKDEWSCALPASYGFTKVVTGVDTPEHHSGPAFCVVAERA